MIFSVASSKKGIETDLLDFRAASIAASLHKFIRSAPEKPGVRDASLFAK